MLKKISVLFLILFLGQIVKGQALFGTYKSIESFFDWQPERKPIFSAHRGGPATGYPENCIETFKRSLEIIPCMLEMDVSMTKDSVLILMHDDSVDRTTTGSGKVKDLTYEEIKELYLLDNTGEQTEFKVPILNEVLSWSINKAVISLDVKRNVPFKKVIDAVKEYQVVKNSMLIVYNIEDALMAHHLEPDLFLSVNIRNNFDFEEIKKTDIPFSKLLAFTGTKESSEELYDAIHKEGSFCIIGTMGNIDKKAESKGIKVYHRLFRKGIDVIAGDLTELAAQAINTYEN